MRKLHLFLLLLASVFTAQAQTVVLDPSGDGGFESGTIFSTNGWTVVNSSTNDWVLGVGAVSNGILGAYISNDGFSYAYTNTTAATSHFYRDVTIPSGATSITLSFNWKGQGQSGFDRMLVYTAPTSVTPVANMPASNNTTMSGATLRFTQPSYTTTTFTPATVTLPATLAGTTVRLIFTWQNNGTLGTSPGAAVDDISLSYCNLPAISGPTSVCAGSSITLSNTVTGGSWSSSMPSVGSIDATSGVLTGIAAGNTTVTYTSGTCTKTATITVKALPAAIGGTKTVCEGATTTLTNAAGGTWSSSNTSVATINISGVVTGIATGNSTIVYTNSMGCSISAEVTVNAVPSAITGANTVCIGSTTTLSCTPTGGMWVSGTPAKATIGLTSGDLTGVSSGTSNITYISPNGCRSTQNITVNILPAAISGISTICVGSFVTMTNTTMGGIWSCSAPTIADVISVTGLVHGLNVGNATISYTNGFGCSKTLDITVNAAVPDISGATNMCTGTTQTLTDATSGGTWSSSAAAVASITGVGVLSALTPGTTNITYTLSPGCKNVLPITVNSTPPAIGGTMQVCEGGFTTFVTNALTGGSWSSSNPSVGSVDATTGEVTGLVAGTTTIVYSMGTSCSTSKIFTVNPTPGAISGNPIACIGSTTTLIPATLGGATWTSSNTSVATVGVTSGVVSGLVIGTSTITYALTTGCYTTFVVTATPTPANIVGANFVCIGETTTLTDTDPGGLWSSSNAGKATVGTSSGIVTGVTTGTTKISYTIAGCSATKTISVNSLPAAITGTAVTCVGGTTTLAIGTTGGTWSSSAPSIAAVGTSGIVTGVSSGTAIISYTNAGGCSSTATVNVNPATPPITGPTSVCTGSTIALSIATTGGTWSSSSTTKATISAAGIVTGVSAGTTTITYAVSSTCRTTAPITVNALPAAIGGTLNVCAGVSTTLTDATTGGTWSSTSSLLTIGSATGIVTGITAGTATVTYMLPTGCYKTATFTVKPVPGTITGASVVCPGKTIALSNPTTGGASWTSSTPAVATVVSSTGIVTGVANGTTTITYTLTSGCYTTKVVSVNPAASAISGTLLSCAGTTQTLSNTGGGSWSSSNSSVATVGSSTGIVSALMGGTSTITYTLPSGCYTTSVFTVNPLPVTISGASSICVGSTTTLTDATTGGTWVSGTPAIATVVSGTGLVTAVSTGVATISYVMTTTGCYRTTTIAVNPAVPAISGSNTVCTGSSTMLSNATSGGLWTSSNTAAATVVASTGSVTGVAAGNATITYALGSGCYATYPMTVNQTPAAITGLANVCEASTITLSSTTSGAVWSSSNTAAGTVNASTGVVAGIATGSTTISYTLGSCSVTKSVSVHPLPSPITGTFFLCSGTYTVFSSFTALGTSWTSSNTATGTIGVTSGGFTALSGGTTNITYTTTAGCYVTQQVTVVTAPPANGGASQVCIGSTATVTNAISGGSWISSNPTVATIGSGTGVVTGLTVGTTEITYTLGSSCISTTILTVNPLPNTITGTPSVCETFTTNLANTTVSGTWSSSNTAFATVGAGTGVVTGVLAGNANISYIVTATGCYRSVNVTVNAQPAAVTGTMAVCAGSTTTLANTVSGGVWSSSNTAVGTVNSSTGVVAGIAAGTTTISYTLGSCFSSAVVTVNPLPNTITGTLSVCETFTTTLASTTPSGTWSSSNASIATVVSGTGVVTGVLAGNANISYTITATGCLRSVNVTVNAQPAAISGTLSVCESGGTTALGNTVSGGVWSSSNTAVGTVNSSTGVVTGIISGTTRITYTLGSCFSTAVVIVNALPNSITGTLSVCETSTTTLASTTSGGTWTSSTPAVGSVNSSTGVVTGISAGNTTITYTITASGCFVTAQATVNTQPAAITGTAVVCQGNTTALSNATSGGIWSSATPAVGTVSATGIVTGVSAGTTTISYTIGSCASTRVVTVNAAPNSITGTLSVCETFTTTLSNTTPSGTWTSSTPAVGSINSSTGVFTGVSAGNTTITYTVTATGCFTTAQATVNTQPAAITGTAVVCQGNTTALSNATSGGIWSSATPAVGTVGATGIVAGISAGTTTISYTIGSCAATQVVTVNATPNAITGTLLACEGNNTTLSSTTSGGTWTSSTPAVATIVSGTGVLTGVSAGNTTITYTVTATGCFTTAQVTVTTSPAAITGTNTICQAATTTLGETTSGGTWQSSNTGIATVGSATGLVTGVAGGNVTISYVMTGTGCYAVFPMTINALPATIGGTLQVCEGSTTTLTNSTSGGTWSSSTPAVGTVNSATGVVAGISAGNTTITYTITASGCFQTAQVTVNVRPSAITGTATVCVNSSTTLSSTPSGGTWTSSTPANGTVNASTGAVTGVASGTTTITYTLATGCLNTRTVTVNALPNAITGTQSVCVGSTTTLSNTTPSGTWSSSTPAIGTVNSGTGVVTGISNGNTTISYTITATGCASTAVVTVNPNPGSITGTPTVCVGYTTALGNSLSGGTWSGTNNAAGTIDASTGIVTGIAAGTTRISYIVSGCFATQVATVLAVPAAIGGTASVCEGSSTTLTNATASGTWTSSNTGIATTGSTGSPVTWNGIAQGNATITYTIANGCFALRDVTVNQTPTAFSPSPVVCQSSSVTLTSTPSGGTWTSSNGTTATIGSATGILNGVNSAGSANISYTLANGCRRITAVTVNALPNTITSASQTVCEGGTITYTNTTPSGTWSSANTGVATVVSGTGVITGVLAGNTSISYTITATGCARGRTLTVNAAPTSIGGSLNVCNGLTSTLTGTPSGGTWTSGNAAIATVGSSTGIVTAQSAGTVDISYISSGCSISSVFTVTAAPATITPTVSPFVCVGFTTTLANTTPSGTWTSGNTGIATVGSADGVVTGVSGTAGGGSQATISYTISTGCSATRVVTVFPNPSAPIVSAQQGTLHSICTAPTQSHVNLSNASGFASTWVSSNTAVGTVGITNGVLSGISAGTTIITFTQLAVNGGCYTTTVYTVNATASAGTISGPSTVIIGNQITLASSVGSGGTWTSSTPAIGTVNSSTGVVTGVSAGNTTITYTFNNGCGSATATYTVSVTTSRPGNGTVYGGPKDPAYLSNVLVYPNPNNGSFIIDGEWYAGHDEEVTMEVRDMLGRLIYDEKITTVRGGINHNVSLGNNLARGMYVLTLRSVDKNASIHFAVGE